MDLGNSNQSLIEFYTVANWAWKPEDRAEILDALRNLDVAKTYFEWDTELECFFVRCVAANKHAILEKFRETQRVIELRAAEEDRQSILVDVSAPTRLPEVPVETELNIPSDLCKYHVVAAWQDLQPQDRRFSTEFLMDGARKAIERYHDAKISIDETSRVIFVGASSETVAELIKAKLTTLFRGWAMLRPATCHVFFVECKASAPGWTVDVRNIKEVNPVLAPSTLLDPLDHKLPEKYRTVFNDAYCLRLCYKDHFDHSRIMSTFGPRAQDNFGDKEPDRSSPSFLTISSTLKAHNGPAVMNEPDGMQFWVDPWIEKEKQHYRDLANRGADDLIPILPPRDLASYDPWKHMTILDVPEQGQLALELQPALRPQRRTITVPHPDSLPKSQELHPQTFATRGASFDQCTKHYLQVLMSPMRSKYGRVELRAEIGRFFMENVEKSGVARNKEGEQANGWKPEQLLLNLGKSDSNTFFNKILSYWGSDLDYLVNMKNGDQRLWTPVDQGCTFYDFYFHTWPSAGAEEHFVLEVDGQNFSWTLREAHNPQKPILVHCLSQSWDFRLVALHDYALSQNMHFAAFARALIESLVIMKQSAPIYQPPVMEFRYKFDGFLEDHPVTIDHVRVRQLRRFRSENEQTFLDLTEVIPTVVENIPGTNNLAMHSQLCDDHQKGVFKTWYEASISSTRMEELLKENASLAPGDEVSWTLEQIEEEGIFEDIYRSASELVKSMDGVGVKCDNGMSHYEVKTPASIYQY